MTLKSLAASVLLGLAATQAVAQAPAARQAGDPRAGRQAYVAVGCYACHGYAGQGAETGPRLAPGVMPLEVFRQFVRTPPANMPHYSAKVLADAEVADMHAYLSALPKPRSSQEIPILRDVPPGPVAGAQR